LWWPYGSNKRHYSTTWPRATKRQFFRLQQTTVQSRNGVILLPESVAVNRHNLLSDTHGRRVRGVLHRGDYIWVPLHLLDHSKLIPRFSKQVRVPRRPAKSENPRIIVCAAPPENQYFLIVFSLLCRITDNYRYFLYFFLYLFLSFISLNSMRYGSNTYSSKTILILLPTGVTKRHIFILQ
jgi:hypothetical protein